MNSLSVTFVLLFSLATIGCSNFFLFKKSQPQPVTQRELPKTQTAPVERSASDRLRDDAARGSRIDQAPEPPRAVQPAQAQEPPRPEPARAPAQPSAAPVQPAAAPAPPAAPAQPSAAPAEVAPVPNSVEPDPRAVIDWLLKDRR